MSAKSLAIRCPGCGRRVRARALTNDRLGDHLLVPTHIDGDTGRRCVGAGCKVLP